MRKFMWAAGLLLVPALASPARSQGVSIFQGSFNPQPIINQPVDMSNVVDMSNIVTPIPAPPKTSSFSLASLIPKITLPSFPPIFGTSPLPPPSSFPSTHYQDAYKPLKPILPD